MTKFTSILAILAAAVPALAWDVQIYDQMDGAATTAPSFNFVEYRSDSNEVGTCIQVGANPPDGGITCSYSSGPGLNQPAFPCTAPFSNPAQFALVGDQTQCNFYVGGGCNTPLQSLNSQYSMNLENPTTDLWFQCQNQ